MIQFPQSDWTRLADELGIRFAERAAEADATDAFVAPNYLELKEKRVFAAAVPAELGGGGASIAEIAGFLRTLAHHCGSTALALSMHTHLVGTAAWRWRNQKAPVDALLKRVAAEQLVLVSTGAADWIQGTGKAEKVDGGWRVNARKIFCSGAPAGGLMMTTAVTQDPAEGATVLQIAVPVSAPGVKVQDNWRTLGMRGTGSHDITLEDVFGPDAAVALRRPSGKWHPLIHVVCLVALPIVFAVYVGVAEAARDLALELARRKRDDKLLQSAVGEMENEMVAAQLALSRMIELATAAQPGPATSAETLSCRAILGRAVRATVDKAIEVAGGASFFRANRLERLFRDVQGSRFHPLQDAPQRLLAGRVALGLPIDD